MGGVDFFGRAIVFENDMAPFSSLVSWAVDWMLVLRSLIGCGGIGGFAWYVCFYLVILFLVPFIRLCFPRTMKWWVAILLTFVPLTIVFIAWTLLDKGDQFEYWRARLCHLIPAVVARQVLIRP